MTFSSEPPTKPLFLWGILKVKIEISSEIEVFKRELDISSENLKFSSVQARLVLFKIRALWDILRDTPKH